MLMWLRGVGMGGGDGSGGGVAAVYYTRKRNTRRLYPYVAALIGVLRG